MIIIIDGYNVLKQVMSPQIITQQERQKFINQLNSYARNKGHKIVIVFDAGPIDTQFKQTTGNVTIIYSGTQETADDVICSYLARHRAQDLLLISSDRALRNYAQRMGIESLPAVEFYALMRSELPEEQKKIAKKDEVIVKLAHDEINEELDLLMQGISYVPQKSEDIRAHKRKTPGNMPSKEERRIAKKIRKL